VTSLAPFKTFVSLTKREDSSISSCNLSNNDALDEGGIADLERYLDATKSNLLFARKVMLVEGPAEAFLIPAMAKAVLGQHLERLGISVIAIYGVHFDVYANLFREGSLEKKCAVVADADLKPSDASDDFSVEEDAPDLASLAGEYVQVFAGPTTFERELVMEETLPLLIATTEELGAPMITKKLRDGLVALQDEGLSAEERSVLLFELGTSVLNTAKRFGKARFAQIASRYAAECTKLPKYIQSAIDWLRE